MSTSGNESITVEVCDRELNLITEVDVESNKGIPPYTIIVDGRVASYNKEKGVYIQYGR